MTGGSDPADDTAERPDGAGDADASGDRSADTAANGGRSAAPVTNGDGRSNGDTTTGSSDTSADSTNPFPDTVADLSIVAGLFTATLAVLGAARPLRTAGVDAVSLAIVGLGLLSLAAVFAVRHGILSRTIAGPLVSLTSAGGALGAVYGLTNGYTTDFGVPPIADAPSLLVAFVGSILTVAAGTAIYADLSTEQLARRLRATIGYSLLGAFGYATILAWVTLIGGLAVPLLTGEATTELPTTTQSVLTQVATVLGTASVAGAYLTWTGRGRSYLDLRIPRLRDLGYVLGGIAALAGIAIVIGLLLGSTGVESTDHSSFDRAQGTPELLLVLAVASILVIGPFEELLYRNVIQKGLYEYFSKPGAIVVASVAFASAHLIAYSGGSVGGLLVSLGIVFALSLALGIVYARTNNLLVPALVHGLYNAFVFYTQYLELVG
ncbi:putative metal-dependent membrane protease [Halovivax ruber XH-70]|uniref:Putative metal-dependent membrane protease n=1 Tax=Halovivax ruber (strain DSM 18193 / JCM 13892 / XH-70) TaxID=797302 RepID=L0I7R8_HALRX|nr:CPBP family intramembrane glutamic endopeptidase [Halovivax ruber]AGB14744.1 putative metal-dependent membrane protease [Halovivax ruber XH-70]